METIRQDYRATCQHCGKALDALSQSFHSDAACIPPFNRYAYARGTWIEFEQAANTPRMAQLRKGRAIFPDGKLRAFRAGIPDTFFSIPAHARIRGKYLRGYIASNSDDGSLEFRIMDSHKQTFSEATQ